MQRMPLADQVSWRTTERPISHVDHLDEFRRRLATARRELLDRVATTDEELATLEPHQPGAPAEDVSREQVHAVLSRLEGREKHELDEIRAAQARLEAGAYGICEGCAQPIPLGRLRAMPTARYCVRCQDRVEHRTP
jgi:DnaK suppressor protein